MGRTLPGRDRPTTYSAIMLRVVRLVLAVFGCSMLLVAGSVAAQTTDPKASPDHPKSEAGKDAPAIKSDEAAEAARPLSGPAARAECVWLGERAVGLMWRDDLDTAFRHLDLYDRFGCPGEHIQVSFRCVVRQGNIDQKSTETFNARVHSCWMNPALPPVPTAAVAAEKPGTK
jgi:hypothetical protein